MISTVSETFHCPSSQPEKSYPYLVGLFNLNVFVSTVYVAGLVTH